MDKFRSVCVCACFLGTVLSIAGTMIPSEKFAGQMRVIFSLIFLLAVISPFVKGEITLDMPDFSESYAADYSDVTRIRLEKGVGENVGAALEEELKKHGITPWDISVEVHNSPDGSISITKARITLRNKYDKRNAERIAREALGGAAVEIIIGEEEENGTPETESGGNTE